MPRMIKLNKKDTKRIFKSYDMNQDNFLDLEELRALVRDLDIDFEEMDDPELAFNYHVEYLLQNYDKNGDGVLSYEEFI